MNTTSLLPPVTSFSRGARPAGAALLIGLAKRAARSGSLSLTTKSNRLIPRLWFLAAVASIGLLAPEARAIGITIYAPPVIQAYAYDYDAGTLSPSSNLSTTLPSSGTRSATRGGSSASASYTFTNNLSEAEFSVSTEVGIDDPFFADAYVYFNLYFRPTEDLTYSITGAFLGTRDVPDNGAQRYAELRDFTASTYSYYEHDHTYGSSAGPFAFESNLTGDGATGNSSFGSLSGSLLAGHYYYFHFIDRIWAPTSGQSDGAHSSGAGFTTLTLTSLATPPTQSVPDAGSTLSLLGAGLLGLGLIRRNPVNRQPAL